MDVVFQLLMNPATRKLGIAALVGLLSAIDTPAEVEDVATNVATTMPGLPGDVRLALLDPVALHYAAIALAAVAADIQTAPDKHAAVSALVDAIDRIRRKPKPATT